MYDRQFNTDNDITDERTDGHRQLSIQIDDRVFPGVQPDHARRRRHLQGHPGDQPLHYAGVLHDLGQGIKTGSVHLYCTVLYCNVLLYTCAVMYT